jgi:hypothetical protein
MLSARRKERVIDIGNPMSLNSTEKAFFASFLSPLGQEGRLLAGRDLPVLLFRIKKE